ncbi:DUF6531 domain-containing protein, partial [Streptomyces coelicoflavus]
DAAREAKNKIDEASDAGIQNRSWWEDVGDWFSDNWDNIVAVCKVVVAIVGIIAMVIGGPILGAIVLVAALVVLADTLYKYSKGQASLWDVGLAALDCIPGMKGLTTLGGLAKGLKGGMAAMKGIKGGLKGMGLAVRGLGKNARAALADGAKGAYNRLRSKIKGCGDPVDAATGQMFLAMSDVSLPAALPLGFTRRVSSGYRTGWWFGPSWSSTVDQRLEVDEHGLVLVTEDGRLLAYPHPEGTDIPVPAEEGVHGVLTLLSEGGYRLDDPVTGQSYIFAPPRDGVCVLTRVVDRNHNVVDFEYSSDGAPLAIRHSGGYLVKVTTEDARVTALSLAGAAEDGSDLVLREYGYTDGNLTSVTGPPRPCCDSPTTSGCESRPGRIRSAAATPTCMTTRTAAQPRAATQVEWRICSSTTLSTRRGRVAVSRRSPQPREQHPGTSLAATAWCSPRSIHSAVLSTPSTTLGTTWSPLPTSSAGRRASSTTCGDSPLR